MTCYGYTERENGEMGIVLEYADKDNLRAIANKVISPAQLLYQIALGTAKLHAQQIIHRDLKMENILVSIISLFPRKFRISTKSNSIGIFSAHTLL